jgi:hypothetical protein
MEKKIKLSVFIMLVEYFVKSHVILKKNDYFNLIEINNDLLNYSIDNIQYYNNDDDFFYDLIEYIYKNSDLLTPHNVEKILYCDHWGCWNIKPKKSYAETIQFFVNMGYKFTDEIIYNIFISCDYQAINILLNTKIKITSNMFKNLFSRHKDNIKDCINLCINFGYEITKDDLIYMLRNNLNPEEKMVKKEYLNDEVFIKNIAQIIKEKNIFPNIFDIKPDIESLLYLIKKCGKINEIKKSIKDNKIKPTIACLREACKHKSYTAVTKYLVDTHGLKPDIECMRNAIESNANSYMSYIFENYTK